MRRYFPILFAFVTSILALAAPAARTTASVQLPRVSSAPQLKAIVESGATPQGMLISDFRQRTPADGAPASHFTSVYLSYDDRNIYAVFVCKDDPSKVRAHWGRRDSIGGDDVVSLALDTFHDGRRAYEFMTNPLGIQSDAIIAEGQDDDYKFDTIWHSEGRVTRDGYVVIMAIPFRSLRFSSAASNTWGVAVGRYVARDNEFSTWPHITRKIEAYVPQFAALNGFEAAGGKGIQLNPYVFLSSDRFLDNNGLPARQNDFRGGLDAKFTLKDRFTFDFTANPDFSQVESDEPQVTLNQRYEVFFPEHRPFFTEASDFFQTPETLLFTRRIVDPRVGIRMTGRAGGLTLGALSMDDRAPGIMNGSDFDGSATRIAVVRAKYAFGKDFDLGAFVSSRTQGSDSNQVLSADMRWRINPTWVATAQLARSESGGAAANSGSLFYVDLQRASRKFNFYTRYRERSPEFRADLGFIPRVDIRQWRTTSSYRWYPRRGPLNSFGPSTVFAATWDFKGKLQDTYYEMPVWFLFKHATTAGVGKTGGYELFSGLRFHKQTTFASFSTEWLRWMNLSASYEWGSGINYDPVRDRAPFLGSTRQGSLSLSFNGLRRLRVEYTYLYSQLGASGATAFTDHILRTKVSYAFSRRLWIRSIVDYNAVLRNSQLVDLSPGKKLTADFLISYVVNPGTAIYAGYSNTFENLMRARPDQSLERVGAPTALTSRRLFVKVSYLFRP